MPSFKDMIHLRVTKAYLLSAGKRKAFVFGKVSDNKSI